MEVNVDQDPGVMRDRERETDNRFTETTVQGTESPWGPDPLAGGSWLASGLDKPTGWCPRPMALAPSPPGGRRGWTGD